MADNGTGFRQECVVVDEAPRSEEAVDAPSLLVVAP